MDTVREDIIEGARPSPLNKDRVTVVQSAAYQPIISGGEATQSSFNFSILLDPSEEPYARRCKVGESWQRLDFGWLANRPIALLCIDNIEGTNLQFIPSEEDQKKIAGKVLQLSFSTEETMGWCINPRAGFIGVPASTELYIRCMSGEARYRLTAFPG